LTSTRVKSSREETPVVVVKITISPTELGREAENQNQSKSPEGVSGQQLTRPVSRAKMDGMSSLHWGKKSSMGKMGETGLGKKTLERREGKLRAYPGGSLPETSTR